MKHTISILLRVGRGVPGTAADEIRVPNQFASCQADRPDDSAEYAGKSGQSDQIERDPSRSPRVSDDRLFIIDRLTRVGRLKKPLA